MGKPSKPHRAWHGARSRPRLAWELLGGPARLGSTLALSSSCSNSLLTASIEAAYTADRPVLSHEGPGAGADRCCHCRPPCRRWSARSTPQYARVMWMLCFS